MADYIYLVENRLSPAQLRTLSTIRNIVRSRDFTLFLTGGAVRDLTGGGSVRDLDFTVQGDATALRAELEASGARFDGENGPAHALFFTFPGGVRAEIGSAMSITYAKPGVPTYHPSSIIEDLRRRDFTANAMALSLNEGSYGLLMDPLNGVADIENRELRLASNYGFIEDPSIMIRAVRLSSRLGLHMEERTRQRYDNAKEDDAIGALSKFNLAYELEEIFHEEDPLRAMRSLDAEGWLKVLSQKLQGLKPNEAGLSDLRDKQGQLQTQGILSDASALAFSLLTEKLPPADVKALKAAFARPGFVREIDTIEERTRELQTRFAGKEAGTPSVAWRILHEAEPDRVLSMFFTAKAGTVPSRLKTFLTESPTARQRIPYSVLQEMRITPDLPVYAEVLDKLFFELMDGKLATTEDLKAYLEPYSPPAPPPTISLRRARTKKEARPSRAKAKKAAAETVLQQEEAVGVQEGILEPGVLTGPDRGTEPTATKTIEGSVAPLAPGAAEPVPVKEKRPAKKAAPPVVEPAAVEPVKNVAASVPVKKVASKAAPEPVAKRDAKASQPAPVAAAKTAAKQPAEIPQTKTAVASKGKEVAAAKPKRAAKSVAPPVPVKKAAAPAARKQAPVTASKPAVKAVAAKVAATQKAAPKKAAPPAKRTPAKQVSRLVPAKAAAKKESAKKVAAKAPAKKAPAKKSPAKKSPLKSPAKKTSRRR